MVLATDASEDAYGITASWWDLRDVAAAGRNLERKRFLRQASTKARTHFDMQNCLDAFDASRAPADVDPGPDPDEAADGNLEAVWEVDPDFRRFARRSWREIGGRCRSEDGGENLKTSCS